MVLNAVLAISTFLLCMP